MAEISLQRAFDLAVQHHRVGRLRDAELLYRKILAQQPGNPHALHLIGLIAHQTGRRDLAADLIRRAIERKPVFPDAYNNLGLVLREKGQLNEAAAAFRQAKAQNPTFADAYYNLGIALKDMGDYDAAVAAFSQAVAIQPDAKARNNLGALLATMDRFDEAVGVLGELVRSDANYPDAHNNLGGVLLGSGQVEQAILAYRQAVALAPANAEFHHNLALALLVSGELGQGWDEYEWRFEWKGFPQAARHFAQPRWDGSPLNGRTLLLHAEQGFGDAIQFIRYLPMAAGLGGQIVLECPAELVSLFQPMAGQCKLVEWGKALPAFDVHCPLLSLPRMFKTTLDTIPADVPYVFPSPELSEFWRRRLSSSDSVMKIGLAWAGNPAHQFDRRRSLSLDQLAPLSSARGVRFYSLQKGVAAAQAKSPPRGLELIDWSEEFRNFNDAGLMANLDLVITVDTAVAHLAGALGKPVWVMLQFMPDWRWLLKREDSPWYPTMRLFRQQSAGNWDGVIARVAGAIAEHCSARVR
jgi:tetratricopeptide (TPR) repeat protein